MIFGVLFKNSQDSSPLLKPKVFSAPLSVLKLYFPINSAVSVSIALCAMHIGSPYTVVLINEFDC